MRVRFFFIFFLLAFKAYALDCSTPNIPISDPAYRYLDKLVAHGLVKTVIVGQRPYSRNQIAKMLEEALQNWEGREYKNPFLHQTLNKLADRFQTDLTCRHNGDIDKVLRYYGPTVWQEIIAAKSPSRQILDIHGDGELLHAFVNPLFDNKEGRHLVSGFNNAWEFEGSIGATPYFSFHFHPRFQLQIPENGSSEQAPFIHEVYGKTVWNNLSLLIGRAGKEWGQSKTGGGILSNQARPLDQITLSSDRPFDAWIFGPTMIHFFYSDLGHEQRFPHPYFVGWKFSFQPVEIFEWGFGLAALGGGEGSPSVGFSERISDVFGMGDGGNLAGTNAPTSNRIAQLDWRLRIPPLRGIEIFMELIADDTVTQLNRQFDHNMGFLTGLYIPRLDESGKMDLRLEYKTLEHRIYLHHIFTDGWTLNGKFLGDNLGPQSHGAYLDWNYDWDENLILKSFFAFEQRDADTFFRPQPEGNIYIKSDIRPDENRYRGGFGFRFEEKKWIVESQIAFEKVFSFNHVQNSDRNNFSWEGRLTIPFENWWSS